MSIFVYKNWGPLKHLSKSFTLQTRVGISVRLFTLDMRSQLSLSIAFLMLTALFSTHGFQNFSFPFTQHNATSGSDQQHIKSIETCPFKATNTSFKTLINKTHPNNSKRGMNNFYKGAALVLTHKRFTFIPKVVSTQIYIIPQ